MVQTGIPPATAAAAALRVLMIEDDPEVAEIVTARLRMEGFGVTAVPSAEEGLEELRADTYDLVLLDLGLPGMSGHDACRVIREQRGDDVPIIFLSGTSTVEDRLAGFAAGADDYVAKPVDYRELVMRVRAVTRRHQGPEGGSDEYAGPDGLLLHAAARTVSINGEPVTLTPTEFLVLRELLVRRGEALAADAISSRVWGYETFGDRNYLEAQISRLRSKLAGAGAPGVIETVRGFGYIVR